MRTPPLAPVEYALVLKDCATYYSIENIVQWESKYSTTANDEFVVTMTDEAHRILKTEMKKNNIVTLKKPLALYIITANDFLIEEGETLENVKHYTKIHLKSMITPQITKESSYTMYSYMNKYAQLLELGFVITDSNREDVYMQIIDEDNDDTIEILEDFLNAKDRLNRGLFFVDAFEKVSKRINQSKEIEEIYEIAQEFEKSYFQGNIKI